MGKICFQAHTLVSRMQFLAGCCVDYLKILAGCQLTADLSPCHGTLSPQQLRAWQLASSKPAGNKNTSLQDGHYNLIRYNQVHVTTYIPSLLPYSVGQKQVMSCTHRRVRIIQGCLRREVGIVGTTYRLPITASLGKERHGTEGTIRESEHSNIMTLNQAKTEIFKNKQEFYKFNIEYSYLCV